MELKINETCVGCGACATDCPVGAPAVCCARTVCRRDGARVEFL